MISPPTSVSVIVPCYNAQGYLDSTLASIFAQSFRPQQVICVDDGSTDSTAEILTKWPVQVLRHPGGQNRGQAASIELALSIADGDLIAFCDADDLWVPSKLAAHVAHMQADLECVLSYSNGIVIDDNNTPLHELISPSHRAPTLPDGLLLNCYIRTPSSVVIRRPVLAQVGGPAIALQSWDHDLWLRLRERSKFCYLPEILIRYRRHAGQLSERRRQWEDGTEILRRARSRYPYARTTVRRRRAVLHFRLGHYDLRHGNSLRGIWHWTHALVLDPARAIREAAGNSRHFHGIFGARNSTPRQD